MSSSVNLDPRLAPLVEGGERFALLTHVNADGDGLGSSIALYAFLRGLGKRSRVIVTEPVPDNYRFLALAGSIELYQPGESDRFVEEADAVFVLDNGSMARLGPLEAPTRRSRGVKVCIDHHETIDPGWDIAIVDEKASASGEIVYEILQALGGQITAEIAEALYVSIITDTGHFRFSKTRPLSHRIAAHLLEHGLKPDRIYQEIYERNSEGYVRLLGQGLSAMQRAREGALVWTSLDLKSQQDLDALDLDTGGIVNTLLAMVGVRVAMLFREMPNNRVKVSLRSKGVDVHQLAVHHGGGGHRNAAGILLEGSLPEVAGRLLDDASALLP